jgi:recombination protein RecT
MSTLPAKSDGPPPLKERIEAWSGEFRKALPSHITPERFVRTAQTAVAFTRNIDKAKPASVYAACLKAAQDGLILDGREAALVVDYTGEAQYRPMMRGLLRLAYNSGQIKSLVVETVRQNDEFIESPTDEEHPIRHNIDRRQPRGEVYAVYALARLKDGGVLHEVMSVEDVNAIRDRSDAYRAFKAGKIKSTPWSTDWSEMARKTVFRRLSKYLPSSTDKEDRLALAAERIDEDYTFEDASAEQPVAPIKKRGAAAAALNRKPEPEPEREPVAEAEIIDYDEDGVINDDPTPTDEDRI